MTDRSRRETMLEELIAMMRRHHRRRRLWRRIGAVSVLVLVAGGGAWIVRGREATEPPGIVSVPGPRVTIVRGSPRTGLVRIIDDDELVQRLAEIDRPAGVIRCEGRVWLSRAVADADLPPRNVPAPPL